MLLLWALSGFVVLAMETIWIRRMSLWAGNTVTAATLVIAVFFAMAALGNLLGARLVSRAERPLLLYARYEIAAGLAALATFGLSEWLGRNLPVLPGGWVGQSLAAVVLVGPASLL